ncbi:MAG: hypothetical protein R3E39_04175 [Anaerolineae bacterium]
MAIDYVIDYKCYPKQELTTDSIVEWLKGRARAEAVIALFRRNGDNRPTHEIGFELARNTPDGTEETRVVMVQDLLDRAEQLAPYEHYCEGCPANVLNKPFGCIGQVEYPISTKAEGWLLKQLPTPDQTLAWMMLRQGIQEFRRSGESVNAMRGADQPFFEQSQVLARQVGELQVNSNQLFEMLFLLGHIRPSYGAMLLVFFNAIRRDLEADEIMKLPESPEDALDQYPFLIQPETDDDASLKHIKQYIQAVYVAWLLHVALLLDV